MLGNVARDVGDKFYMNEFVSLYVLLLSRGAGVVVLGYITKFDSQSNTLFKLILTTLTQVPNSLC